MLTTYKNLPIEAFRIGIDPIPDWFMDKVSENKVILKSNAPKDCHIEQRDEFKTYCEIITTDGVVTADYGDYIIKNEDGNLYHFKPDIPIKLIPYKLGEFNTARTDLKKAWHKEYIGEWGVNNDNSPIQK